MVFGLGQFTQSKISQLQNSHAEVAQLVERNLAKVEVAGSSLVFRSRFHPF
jgi:hypothetical protein